MTNLTRFESLLSVNGQNVMYHREYGGIVCPCVSEEGFRSPQWHLENPTEPVCNEQGFLSATIEDVSVKAFIQPIQSTRATRLSTEVLAAMFGEVQEDDHLGIFPLDWNSVTMSFYEWDDSGDDYIVYDGRRFIVVNVNKIPDPDGGGFHHWEVALRLVKTGRPS